MSYLGDLILGSPPPPCPNTWLGGGSTPSQDGATTILTWLGGTPFKDPHLHPIILPLVPCPFWGKGSTPGSPPQPGQDGGYPRTGHPLAPRKDMGPVEVLWDRDGVPPWKGHAWGQWKYYGMEMGYPSPGCGQTNKLKLWPSLIIRMRAVIKSVPNN